MCSGNELKLYEHAKLYDCSLPVTVVQSVLFFIIEPDFFCHTVQWLAACHYLACPLLCANQALACQIVYPDCLPTTDL